MKLVSFTCSKESPWSPPICKNALLRSLSLSHMLGLLRGPHFNMTRSAHVPSDSTMGSISSPPPVLGSIDLNMLDNQFLQIKLFDVGIGFQVPKEIDNCLTRFLRPPSLDHSELFGLAGSSHGSVESSIRDTSFMGDDVLQISDGLRDSHSLACTGGFVGVLEMDSSVE